MPRGWPQAALSAALATLYPPTCILCGAGGDDGLDLCAGCRDDLPRIGRCCARCALPLPVTAAVPGQAAPTLVCGGCQRLAPPFARCVAVFRYEDPLPLLVAGLKFRGRLNVLRLMGLLLAHALQDESNEHPTQALLPDLIIPVPLHRRRLRQRGYNQSLELARIAGGLLGVPVSPASCERRLATPPQVGLDAAQRLHNVRGAFRATRRLDGLHVTVLDDVVTTGGTVSEVARVLQGAGCRRVDVWTLARTP
jgi:ComF family protein